jgi:hypothetical protein
MKRSIVLVAALLLATSLPVSSEQTDKTMLLLQRVASEVGGVPEVFVGTLPSDVPKVPLPNSTLLGSVRRFGTPAGTISYEMYYDVTTDVLKAYRATLLEAGWALPDVRMSGGVGFVATTVPQFVRYCKNDAPFIGVRTDGDVSDLRVTVTTRTEFTAAACGGDETQDIARQIASHMNSPLPQLRAPDGVAITALEGGWTAGAGTSVVRISNGSSVAALLDAFAAQVVAQGWQPGAKSSAATLASQAFTKINEKDVHLQFVLTISAIAGTQGDFLGIAESQRT